MKCRLYTVSGLLRQEVPPRGNPRAVVALNLPICASHCERLAAHLLRHRLAGVVVDPFRLAAMRGVFGSRTSCADLRRVTMSARSTRVVRSHSELRLT